MGISKQITTLVILVYTTFVTTTNHHFLEDYLPDEKSLFKNFNDVSTRYGREIKPGFGCNSLTLKGETNKVQSGGIIFSSPNYTVVKAQTDTTAILPCVVNDTNNTLVSWIRKKDSAEILTIGNKTHISDQRFYVSNEDNSKNWTLHIRYATIEDAGLYECQVATNPKSSIFVELCLVEAHAHIIGSNRKVVKYGSLLRLSCVLKRSIEAPTYIFWYHEDKMINYNLQGGEAVRHGRLGSELIFPRAEFRHEGNYSCVPSNARQASVTVEVRLQNEKPAAMQHGSKNGCDVRLTVSYILIPFVFFPTIWLQR